MIKKLINLLLLTMILVFATVNAEAISISMTDYDVPTWVNTSFKTYEDYHCITDKSSDNYKFINQWGWVDGDGFLRCNGERDFGINDDYYLVALGSFYGTQIGNKYKITTDTGREFYVCLGDQKNDLHTNATHQYAGMNDVVEFLVNTNMICSEIKTFGSCNVYMPLNGNIARIQKITFNWD